MFFLNAIFKRSMSNATMTEDLMRSIGHALSMASPGNKGIEMIESARLLASLQRTRIYSLDEETTLFVDRQAKDLFECDARVTEIVPDGASLVIEFPYRPTLKAQKVKHRISAQEGATLPVRMGILIQHVGGRIFAGLIVGHRSGPKPPPIMFDLTDLTCPCEAPFWNTSFVLDKLAISSFSGTENDQGVLNGLGQDLMEEMAFALAFLVMIESPDSPMIKGAIHPSGFGPINIETPLSQARYREKFCISRMLDTQGQISAPGWFQRDNVSVASKLASLQQYIEENLSDEALPSQDKSEAVQ